MTDDPIVDILSGDFRLLETGDQIPCPIRELVIEPSLDGAERDLLAAIDFPASPTIVCDQDTYDVLGKRLVTAIPGAEAKLIQSPRADETTVDLLTDQTRHAQGLVAVGSGTLNDLVKYVSHRRQQPYATFATAPSMNGYVTTTASISQKGEKLSLPATPPTGAFFDLEILAAAPRRLIQAGVGDSLCRTTAEIDWLLSHHLLDSTYLETPFIIQAQDEAALIDRIEDLGKGTAEAVRSLVRLLVLGGLGMLVTGSSQPGSQGEHLISHYIDMMQRPHPGSLHGEQVGLATRTMAALQHQILTGDDPPRLTDRMIDRTELTRRFGSKSQSCLRAIEEKTFAGDRLDTLNRRLETRWSTLRSAFRSKSLALERLQTAFDRIGVAADPSDLGIDPVGYEEAILHARELRNRFTMLDLAASAGMLESFVASHLTGAGV